MTSQMEFKVKGTAILTIPLFIQKKFGEDGYNKFIDSISPKARDTYLTTIYPSFWYPIKEILIQPTEKICELFYNGNIRGAWESGHFSAEYALKGIYSLFIRFGSPSFIINRSSTLLPTYYRPSRIEIIENSKKSATLRLFLELHSEILEQRISGWMEAALEICGCHNIKFHTIKSQAKGDPYTEFKSTWL